MSDDLLRSFLERIQPLQQSGDMQAIYDEAKELLASSPDDHQVRLVASGCLIDSGSTLQSLDVVNEGIALIQDLLSDDGSLSPHHRTTLKYNLANGYTARFEILGQGVKPEEAVEAIQEAKTLLQSLVINQREVSVGLLPRVICNYANVLSKLGRNVEAIDQYLILLRRYPEHAVAMANCGIAMKSLRFLSGRHTHRNVHEAWKLLSSACALEEKVLELASVSALEWFKQHLHELEEEINTNMDGGLAALQEWSVHREEVHGQPRAPAWLMTMNHERLLLTLNQNPLDSSDECKDDLFFDGLITEGGDTGIERFSALARTLNILKEEYATARYLFYLPENAPEGPGPHSSITYYGEAFDSGEDFGLVSGVKKTSLRLAVDCFDKIAVFLNEYFELGHEGENYNINNIWFEDLKHKKGTHPTLAQAMMSNEYLRALRDLQRDWYKESFSEAFLVSPKDARDAGTHGRLVLHWLRPSNRLSAQEVVWNVDDCNARVPFILRMVRAAIVYSVLLVMKEEQTRAQEERVRSIEFGFGPGLSDQFLEQG